SRRDRFALLRRVTRSADTAQCRAEPSGRLPDTALRIGTGAGGGRLGPRDEVAQRAVGLVAQRPAERRALCREAELGQPGAGGAGAPARAGRTAPRARAPPPAIARRRLPHRRVQVLARRTRRDHEELERLAALERPEPAALWLRAPPHQIRMSQRTAVAAPAPPPDAQPAPRPPHPPPT